MFFFFFLRSEEEFEEFFGVSLGVGGEYVGHLGGRLENDEKLKGIVVSITLAGLICLICSKRGM